MTDPYGPSRRRLLGGGAAVVGGLLLGSCAAPAAAPPTTDPGSGSAVPASPADRTLVAYFSRAGENYHDGGRRMLETGNTAVLARMLVDRLGCDVVEIEASEAYPSGYDATVARNVVEQREDRRPAVVGALPSLAAYDRVLLGSPIWNVRPPMIMTTFVEGVAWTGTTLHPFVTYAVSGLGSTVQTYERAARGAEVGGGLAVRGEEVADADDQVAAWLSGLGLA